MFHIVESLGRFCQVMPHWGWAALISFFVFCAVIDRMRYFFAVTFLLVFAWLVRDMTNRVEMDSTYQWPFVMVILAGLSCALYLVFSRVRRG